jgi:hypothetical protein
MRILLPTLLPTLFAAFAFLASTPLHGGVLGDDFNQEEDDDYVSLPLLRLSVDAGFSQWIIPDDTLLTTAGKAYADDQQQGQAVSAEAVCYFLPRGGVGLTYIWFLSRTESFDQPLRKGGPPVDVTERVAITYIGPSFWTRIRAGRFGLAHAGFGAGYLAFQDTWKENGISHKAEAQTFALVTSLGWDYSIFRFIGIGISGRFLFSNIREWTVDGVKQSAEDPFNQFMWYNVPLYRFELNAGLRFFL